MAEQAEQVTGLEVCGHAAPWGAVCPLAPGHPHAHDWRLSPLSVTDVASILGVVAKTVKAIPSAELPFFRVGSRGDRRYAMRDVERYLAARREG